MRSRRVTRRYPRHATQGACAAARARSRWARGATVAADRGGRPGRAARAGAGSLGSANGATGAAVEPALSGVPLRAIALEVVARAEQVRRTDDEVGLAAGPLCAALSRRVAAPHLQLPTGCGSILTESSAARQRARRVGVARGARARCRHCVGRGASRAGLHASLYHAARCVIEGASNVLRGGWLAGRAGAFRHRKAWGHHPVALSHAIEAYVRGLRGDGDGCARAQPIVLTRLVRAAAAVAILDAVATASAAETGRSARGGRAG